MRTLFGHVPRDESRAALVALVAGAALMGVKFVAYFLTGSAVIFSDAVESIVNVAASLDEGPPRLALGCVDPTPVLVHPESAEPDAVRPAVQGAGLDPRLPSCRAIVCKAGLDRAP